MVQASKKPKSMVFCGFTRASECPRSLAYGTAAAVLAPAHRRKHGGLTGKGAEFVRAAELARVDRHIKPCRWLGFGRKPKDRKAVALAFIVKAAWNFPATALLIDYLKASPAIRRLCGWEQAMDVPSESTFSRAFA